jgi:hypothetical protein
LDNGYDERNLSLSWPTINHSNVEGGPTSERKYNEKKDESSGQMGGIVPRCRYIAKFGQCSKDHDESRHRTPEGNSGPRHFSRWVELVPRGVYSWRVEGRKVVVHGYVENPNAIEIDEEMRKGSLFEVGLKEDATPVNTTEFHVALSGRNIHQADLEWENHY